MLLHLTYLAIVYSSLPLFVPVHFDFAGSPDAFGRKYRLWLLPAVSVVLWALMSFAARKRPATEARPAIPFQESLAVLKTLVMALMLYITWSSVRTAQHKAFGLGRWLVPVILFGVLGSAVALLIPARNRRKRHMAQ